MLMSSYDRGRVIKAHIAGDNAVLIGTEQYLDLPAVKQVIREYEEEQEAIRLAWAQIDGDAVVEARKAGTIALTDAQRVIQLYRETDLSTSAIAAQLKLRVRYVTEVIAQQTSNENKI